jgi:hypothetical protein
MFTTWSLLKMTHKQFRKANSLILSVLATMLFLMLLLLMVGCVSEREVVYRSVYFADTNGVTTIYYPESVERDLKTPHNDKRWKYVAAKIVPDDGVAKEMKLLPIDLSMDNPHPYILNQQQWSDEYHEEHPECSYGY